MRKKVVLACTVCKARNYSNEKSNKVLSERIEMKKFCKTCNAHTLHQETK